MTENSKNIKNTSSFRIIYGNYYSINIILEKQGDAGKLPQKIREFLLQEDHSHFHLKAKYFTSNFLTVNCDNITDYKERDPYDVPL